MPSNKSAKPLTQMVSITKQNSFAIECGNSQPNNGQPRDSHANKGIAKMTNDLVFWTGLFLIGSPPP